MLPQLPHNSAAPPPRIPHSAYGYSPELTQGLAPVSWPTPAVAALTPNNSDALRSQPLPIPRRPPPYQYPLGAQLHITRSAPAWSGVALASEEPPADLHSGTPENGSKHPSAPRSNSGFTFLTNPRDNSAIAVWHLGSNTLVSCSENFGAMIEQSPSQLASGFPWHDIFSWNESTPSVDYLLRSAALVQQALECLQYGFVTGAMCVIVVPLRAGRLRWLNVDMVLFRDSLGMPRDVMWICSEILDCRPEPALRFHGQPDNSLPLPAPAPIEPPVIHAAAPVVGRGGRRLINTPNKRRNAVARPWDPNVTHFKMRGPD